MSVYHSTSCFTYYREAFRYIPPMSLCGGSSEKPKFLTEPVLSEVKTFLDALTR